MKKSKELDPKGFPQGGSWHHRKVVTDEGNRVWGILSLIRLVLLGTFPQGKAIFYGQSIRNMV